MSDIEALEVNNVRKWPPGTVRLEDLRRKDGQIMLHPIPSEDPNDPLNWTKARKAVNFSLACFYALMIFVLVDIGTVIYGNLNEDLGISFEAENDSFALNTAGLATGCILFIPFALKYGRRSIYLVSISVSLAAAIWSAKTRNTADLYGTNVLAGLAGSISETICQMTIADLFFVHQRATMNAIYLVMVNIGAFLAPVAAGYSAVSQGWRWIWWWCVIFLSVCLLLFIFFYEETKFIPTIIGEQEPRRLSVKDAEQARRESYASKSAEEALTMVHSKPVRTDIPMKTYRQRMALITNTPGGFGKIFRHFYQPFIILFTFPGVAYTAIIYGSLLAWFSVILTTLSIYFTLPPYNFSASGIGLLNLAPFIGTIFGSIYGGPLSDWMVVKLSKRNNGVFEPEMRLWLALPAVLITPAGILMFGLTLAEGKHWLIPSVGAAIFGFGFVTFGDLSLTYLIDSYKDIVGDALVAVAFVRNALATMIVLVLTPWIEAIGLYNTFICCGCLSVFLFMWTVPMLIWGKKFRIMTADRYAKMAARQFDTRTV